MIATGLVVAGTAACGGPSHGPSAAAGHCPSLVVPAYFTPQPTSRWARIDRARHAVRWVILNPDNGPGRAPAAGYEAVVRRDRRAGIAVLGYVPTGQGRRARASVLGKVDRYRHFYGVNDVFFDEAPTGRRFEERYRAFVAAVHAHHGFAVLNPGTTPARGYFDFADAIVTFESGATAYRHAHRGSIRPRGLPAAKIWNIVLGVPRGDLDRVLASARARGVGGLFVTDLGPPNPYDRLPSYWTAEVGAVSARRCP